MITSRHNIKPFQRDILPLLFSIYAVMLSVFRTHSLLYDLNIQIVKFPSEHIYQILSDILSCRRFSAIMR